MKVVVIFVPGISVYLVEYYYLKAAFLGIFHHLLVVWSAVIGGCEGFVYIFVNNIIAPLPAMLATYSELGIYGFFTLVVG